MKVLKPFFKIASVLLLLCAAHDIHGDFVRDTSVGTPRGHVAIQDLAVGDEVIAYTSDGRLVAEPIIQLHTHNVDDLVYLRVDDALIQVSKDHLFYLPMQQCCC